MEIEEAYRRAIEDENVRSRIASGFYLSSALLKQTHLHSADSWILIFFNPKSGKVFSVTVTDKGIEISTIQEPLKKGIYKEMSIADKGNVSEILDLIASRFNEQISQVLISAKPDTWEALVIGKNLKTVYLVIDPKTKKVIKEERGSLIR